MLGGPFSISFFLLAVNILFHSRATSAEEREMQLSRSHFDKSPRPPKSHRPLSIELLENRLLFDVIVNQPPHDYFSADAGNVNQVEPSSLGVLIRREATRPTWLWLITIMPHPNMAPTT
jgi:hypothetical protein